MLRRTRKIRRISDAVAKFFEDARNLRAGKHQFDPPPVVGLEVLKETHALWYTRMTAADWTQGPRDDRHFRHPLLVPQWDDLTPAEKMMDLNLLKFFNAEYLDIWSKLLSLRKALCQHLGQSADSKLPKEGWSAEFQQLFITTRRG